jgi:hypothetical protein
MRYKSTEYSAVTFRARSPRAVVGAKGIRACTGHINFGPCGRKFILLCAALRVQFRRPVISRIFRDALAEVSVTEPLYLC